jgi:NAD(P)-dependent dehydrogenase (short-subunit alcohol dehydrogenase family)
MDCDLSDGEPLAYAAASAFTEFANVHTLCNKAGVSRVGPIETITASDWDWVIGVNLKGLRLIPHQPRAECPCLPRQAKRDLSSALNRISEQITTDFQPKGPLGEVDSESKTLFIFQLVLAERESVNPH